MLSQKHTIDEVHAQEGRSLLRHGFSTVSYVGAGGMALGTTRTHGRADVGSRNKS